MIIKVKTENTKKWIGRGLAIVAFGGALIYAKATKGEEVSPAKSSPLENIYVSPLGVYKLPNIHDKGEWGAGLELGVKVNKSVSLGLQAVSYAGDDLWNDSGYLVDETSLVVHADLFSTEKKTLTLGVLASGVRDWNTDDWGFGVGPEVALKLSENVSLTGGAQIRAWFNGTKDVYIPVALKISF